GLTPAEVELIHRAAPLHDVGKIGVPDAILLKPGRLTAEERKVMQSHTTVGGKILARSRSPVLQLAERIALTHHERWDGGGYAAGLSGEAIPLCGRIVSVVDVFDALTNERPYKRAWPVAAAAAEIESESGHHFDPNVADKFLALLADGGLDAEGN